MPVVGPTIEVMETKLFLYNHRVPTLQLIATKTHTGYNVNEINSCAEFGYDRIIRDLPSYVRK